MRQERLLVEKQELKLNETNRNYKNKLKKKKKAFTNNKVVLSLMATVVAVVIAVFCLFCFCLT